MLALTLPAVALASRLLMTIHDGTDVYAFDTVNGTTLTKTAVDTSALSSYELQWRGMQAYDKKLYMANGKKGASFIATFKCGAQGPLPFSGMYATQWDAVNNSGLNHPYGVAVWSDGVVFATAQNTNSALLYNGQTTGNPAHFDGELFPGAWASYNGGKEDADKHGVRGIALDRTQGLVFVSEETSGQVYVYDAKAVVAGGSVAAPLYTINGSSSLSDPLRPVGVALGDGVVYIGDSNNDRVLCYTYTSKGAQLKWVSEQNDHLNHPAGLAPSADTLFVVSQKTSRIVQFGPSDGSYKGTLADFGSENVDGEGLILLNDGDC
eukprot:Hpha_TRINITY_DN28539_c0_g1::TRINITY_DN28539_c0_g1_i1::g.18602::m.18602